MIPLATVSAGKKEAEKRLAAIKKAFPNRNVQVDEGDGRFKIVLLDGQVERRDVDRMVRIAQDIEPQINVPKQEEKKSEHKAPAPEHKAPAPAPEPVTSGQAGITK